MARATYRIPFEDFDYEGWCDRMGLTALVEPTERGPGFLLHVEGDPDAIKQFSDELSWGPES